MFDHIDNKLCSEYQRKEINGKRHYICPNGTYPSITTVLSGTADKSFLEVWRKRVGEEEADRIVNNSQKRGTNLHTMCEDYLNNKSLSIRFPDALEMFYSIKPILNRLNNIHCLETSLYSDRLKIAGSVDCIAEFDGVLSVVDFKNSRKEKKEEYILDYFLQATFYALAYYEMTNILIKQIVIIVAVENETPQYFIKPIKPYISMLISRRKLF